MTGGRRAALAAAVAAAAAFVVIDAGTHAQSQSAEVQIQLGNEFVAEGRYADALDAFQRAVAVAGPDDVRTARAGVVNAALRVAEFDLARVEAEKLVAAAPKSPEALALHADALWASGLFEEAESRYKVALAAAPDLARGHHGMARALAARSHLDEAMDEAQMALRMSPRDLEIHHTVGAIYERMHKYEEAAGAFSNYVNLLPNKDHSEKADWSRSEIKFLRSFGQRVPFEMDPAPDDQLYTIDFRLVNDKVVVRAKVNDGVVPGLRGRHRRREHGAVAADRAAPGDHADHLHAQRRRGRRRPARPAARAHQHAGARAAQAAQRAVPDQGSAAARPAGERSGEPVAARARLLDDHRLPDAARSPSASTCRPSRADFELPMRLHRLATVRGTVDGQHPANFVVDTGGEVISISRATATAIGRQEPERKIALKVFGSSGWDKDAFLLPGVDLSFDAIRYTNFPVVVLNLNTPSALLGFQLGGIVGHKFLSKYRVGIDLEHSVLRLKQI